MLVSRVPAAAVQNAPSSLSLIRYGGTVPAVIIGEGQRPWWDAILIVEYPTPRAFIEMVTDADYAHVHEHRAAALERGDLIATSMWSFAD